MLDEQDFQKIGDVIRATVPSIIREEMMIVLEKIVMPQFERIDERLDRVESRLDGIDHRFDRMRISW